MPTLPTIQELKSMKYRELQKTCKDLGLKANLKSHEMIGMLLEAQSQATSGSSPTPSPPVQPISSVRLLTTKAESSRLSSVIIHDIPEETNGQELHTATTTRLQTAVPVPLPSAPPVQSKKAKELQRRLGVGRPIVAGGTGARTVTRSSPFEREGIRHSRSEQMEATMPEDSESPGISNTQKTTPISSFQDPSSSLRGEATQEKGETRSPDIERLLSEFVKPLQDQIDTLRAEVKRLQALETEVKTLNAMVKQENSRQVDDEAQIWETTFGTRKQYLVEPSTPPTTSNVQLSSSKMVISAGYTPTFLGKRQAKSSMSEPQDVQREDTEKISFDTLNPVKKRLRLSGEGPSNKGKEVDRVEDSRDYTSTTLPPATGFVVYNDSQEEFLPQTNHLPDTSRLNGPRGTRFTTSSMNAPENQNPFNYFLPEPSTPLFTSAFPYPEPPQSPTPAGFSLLGTLSAPDDRSDVFKTFGLPPPERARLFPSGPSNDATDPAFSLHPPPKRRPPSVDESRSTFGLMPTFAGLDPKSEKPSVTSKTTMYGTELEGDTRFGDFEGVAMGYWSGRF